MKTDSQKHFRRAHACRADRKNLQPSTPSRTAGWEFYVGHVKLTIIGPADHQWFPISGPYYSGPVGTDAEREAARQLVQYLNIHHRDDITIDRPAFDAIRKHAAKATDRESPDSP